MSDREKEIKLLHLDNLQKKTLSNVVSKFLSKKQPTVPDVVGAFVDYIVKFMESSAEGTKDVCDDLGNLSHTASSEIQKLCDAIKLCSGYEINYYKILNDKEIRHIVQKAAAPRNRHTMQRLNELEYRIKVATHNLIEQEGADSGYIENSEDLYMSSLTAINPIIMKNAFVEHIVDMISSDDDHTISDVMNIVKKYSKYLGTNVLTEEVIEGLMHRYNDVEKFRDLGGVHAARIEVFKILEGEGK